MYNLTKSIDGENRITVKLETRWTLDILATLITADCGSDFAEGPAYFEPVGEDSKPRRDVIAEVIPTRRAAIEIAKRCIFTYGEEIPHYRVGDDGLGSVESAVLAHLKTLWAAD